MLRSWRQRQVAGVAVHALSDASALLTPVSCNKNSACLAVQGASSRSASVDQKGALARHAARPQSASENAAVTQPQLN